MTSTIFYTSPAKYVSELNTIDMPRVKITLEMEPDSYVTAKLPVFDGIKGGLEAFFYVLNHFKRAAIDELYV